jgi:hypothetical protein
MKYAPYPYKCFLGRSKYIYIYILIANFCHIDRIFVEIELILSYLIILLSTPILKVETSQG